MASVKKKKVRVPSTAPAIRLDKKGTQKTIDEICVGVTHNCRCPNCYHLRGDY